MFEDIDQEENNTKRMMVKYVIPGLGIIALLSAVFAGSLFMVKRYPNVLGLDTNSSPQSTTSPQEVNSLIEDVGELILLPEGETPSVATVNDLSQVRSQDFFRNAEVGDKVLIYSAAKKAYLYRPNAHKLIEVGIVDQGTPETDNTQNTQPEVISPTPLPTQPIETPLPTSGSPTPTGSVLISPNPSPTP